MKLKMLYEKVKRKKPPNPLKVNVMQAKSRPDVPNFVTDRARSKQRMFG